MITREELYPFLAGLYGHLAEQLEALQHTQIVSAAIVQTLNEVLPNFPKAYEKHFRSVEAQVAAGNAAALATIAELERRLKEV